LQKEDNDWVKKCMEYEVEGVIWSIGREVALLVYQRQQLLLIQFVVAADITLLRVE